MIVLKIGGSISEEYSSDLIEDLQQYLVNGVIIVHGGGRVVNELSSRIGIKQKIYQSVSGFKTRLTDEETLDLIKMVFAGKINKEIVSELIKRGIKAIGLSGVDGELVLSVRKKAIKIIDERGRIRIIRNDLSGKPIKINVNLLKSILSLGYTPVIAPIGIDEDGQILNLDGDRVAARIAGEMRCEKLVIFTDVPGVLIDGELVETIKADELERYMERVGGGMKRKLYACKEAISLGVKEVIIASGLRRNPLKKALAHDKCTVILGE